MELTDFTIKLRKGLLFGRVNGAGPVALLDLDASRAETRVRHAKVKIGPVGTTLTAEAAAALNATFGTTALTDDTVIGDATVCYRVVGRRHVSQRGGSWSDSDQDPPVCAQGAGHEADRGRRCRIGAGSRSEREASVAGDWSKGGLRYKKLKRKVPEVLAPERVEAFFIAVAAEGAWERRERRWAAQGLRGLTKREAVVAVTDEHLVVIPLKGPGVFSWALDEPMRYPLSTTPVGWDGKVLRIGDAGYGPTAFHDEEAERVAAFALPRAAAAPVEADE